MNGTEREKSDEQNDIEMLLLIVSFLKELLSIKKCIKKCSVDTTLANTSSPRLSAEVMAQGMFKAYNYYFRML